MGQTEWSDPAVSELPTGTVTLLLADVEGSTRLWDTQPPEMTVAIARLDAALADLLLTASDEQQGRAAYNAMLFAIGNNHAGLFYPAALPAAQLLVRVTRECEGWVRWAALEILIEFTAFDVDREEYVAPSGTVVQPQRNRHQSLDRSHDADRRDHHAWSGTRASRTTSTMGHWLRRRQSSPCVVGKCFFATISGNGISRVGVVVDCCSTSTTTDDITTPQAHCHTAATRCGNADRSRQRLEKPSTNSFPL